MRLITSKLDHYLLQSFAEQRPGGSLLTLATTHHGELKTLKYSDPRFENACVEFDEARLAPTFRLLWGIPGKWRERIWFKWLESFCERYSGAHCIHI